ncbi:inactive hydroxysteroid dehydrogenase-like protein 1 [Portunus trituberculatus]|uniref:inactive hydroxysteroid dehydrogenase-like protein 1 n=1 Tax=Portunus trituberculatus TaxID=210409 RepID=UPI001E1D0586|nr:inactive hydroxysteroid dehydrogenase-like protein 1 [Portunus trituberculatus]
MSWQLNGGQRITRMGSEALFPCLGALEHMLTVAGLLAVSKILLQLLWSVGNGVRVHFWSRLWKKRLVEDYGRWAVVTGSTDGIGKEYAKELARRGVNLVLVSRTMEKLHKVSAEIVREFGVQTEVIQADFSGGRPIYEDIAKGLQGKEIGILVNNVGVLLSEPMEFGDVSEKDIWSHVNVNVASVPAMTKLVLPGMLKRGRGAIVNLSSTASTVPVPLSGIYSATKAFVNFFSRALEFEYRNSGITIQTLIPSYVSTNMTKYSDLVHDPGVFVPTAQTYASSAINTLGYARHTTGYWAHSLQSYILRSLNERLLMLMLEKWYILQKNSMKKSKE